MRIAAPFIALALSSMLLLTVPAPSRAQEPGPFPSTVPSASPAAGNGYIALGLSAATTSGGRVPLRPGNTATAAPFVSSNAGGFSLDLLGRISDNYLAAVKFDDYAIRGNDNPFISYSQGIVMFNPHGSNIALGLAYLSLQRSTATVNLNGGGIGAAWLPRFRAGASFYGSAFLYPSLHFQGIASSITCLEAGVVISPPQRGGFFYRLNAFAKNSGSNISPTQISGLSAGLGGSF